MGNDQSIKILSDIEHILLRPNMYVGNIFLETKDFWVFDIENQHMVIKSINYIPALYKIFCEVLDNCIDEHIRGYGKQIDVNIRLDNGSYEIRDYARGIPLNKHKEAKVPTPQVVFTQLRSGSNFENEEKRMTVGMNGVGASLATVFSKKLIVRVWRSGKLYQQAFTDNLSHIGRPSKKALKTKETGTAVYFEPDYTIFKERIPVELIRKRCMELAVAFPNLKINLTLNDGMADISHEEYNYPNFEDFVKLFKTEYQLLEDKKTGLKMALCYNNQTETFEQVSNVNGADTFRGGTHVDFLRDIFVSDLRDKIKKESKLETTVYDIQKQMLLICFHLWNAPMFEGQTKEKLVNDKKEFVEHFDGLFTARKVTNMTKEMVVMKEAIIDMVSEKLDKKEMAELRKTQKKLSKQKVAKLIKASSKESMKCSLYITEGDSAISNLAMVRDSKTMAGLPLRGKVLNVMGMRAKAVVENKEIQALMNVIGLTVGEKATSKNLNYGKIIIATDQDMDGYCIRCLLVNFFYRFWPELFDHGRVYILETPLYEVIELKTDKTNYFYNKKDYEDFMKNKNNSKFEVSYFKGLGSCGREAWDYMINEKPNIVRVNNGDLSSSKLKLAFGKDANARKEWLR